MLNHNHSKAFVQWEKQHAYESTKLECLPVCEMIFLALSDSSKLKFQLARHIQIYHVLLRLYELANAK